MKNELRIDWSTLVLNLRGAGLSQTEIAKQIGVKPSTISHLVNETHKTPDLNNAINLLDLHYDLCPDKHIALGQKL